MSEKITNLKELGKYIENEEDVKDYKASGEEETVIEEVYRGEIFMADLSDIDLSSTHIVNGNRPVLIIQNDKGNEHSSNVIVAKITSAPRKYPMHMDIQLKLPSVILYEQLTTIPKSRLKYKMSELTAKQEVEGDEKLMFSLGLDFYLPEKIEVKSKIITQNREGNQSVYYKVYITSRFRDETINISLGRIKETFDEFDQGKSDNFNYIEDLLDSTRGIKLINIIMKENSRLKNK